MFSEQDWPSVQDTEDEDMCPYCEALEHQPHQPQCPLVDPIIGRLVEEAEGRVVTAALGGNLAAVRCAGEALEELLSSVRAMATRHAEVTE